MIQRSRYTTYVLYFMDSFAVLSPVRLNWNVFLYDYRETSTLLDKLREGTTDKYAVIVLHFYAMNQKGECDTETLYFLLYHFQLLHDEWARYGAFYKYQPVDLIR